MHYDRFDFGETYIYYDEPLFFSLIDKYGGTEFLLYCIDWEDNKEYFDYIVKMNCHEDLKKLKNKEMDIYSFLTKIDVWPESKNLIRVWRIFSSGEIDEYEFPFNLLYANTFLPKPGVML